MLISDWISDVCSSDLPRVRSNPRPAPDGLLRSDAFRAGAAAVARRGLVLDIWAYQSQLDEVYDIARALPELTVVVDHCGGPLGEIGRASGRVRVCPNV